METTLVSAQSPLGQLRERGNPAGKASAGLSVRERAELSRMLDQPMEYIHHPLFDEPDAREQIFAQAPEIPEANTTWYQPLMDNISSAQEAKGMVNVILTGEQEKALFLQFNFARYRVAMLQAQIGDGEPNEPQAREMLHWSRTAGECRDHLARTNLALVLAMARRVRSRDVEFGDLVSEGNMALLRAVDKFDVSRGFKFSTYACRAVLKALSRCGQKHTRYRDRFPTDYDPDLEDSDSDDERADDHEADCAAEVRRIMVDNRAALSDVEHAVIHHRFGLAEENSAEAQGPLTLEEVGRHVGLTKERVRQIQNHALTKIRQALEDTYLDGRINPLTGEPTAAPRAS